MNREKILKQILDRLDKLEAAVFGREDKKKPLKGRAENFKGIAGGIRLLISQGIFKNKRTFTEVKEELRKKDYYSSLQAIQTALDRLSTPKGPLIKFKEGKKNYYAERK